MIGTKIHITDKLAITAGELVAKLQQEQPDYANSAVTIAWDDNYAEQEWLVQVVVETVVATLFVTYIVNDETGESRLLETGAEL